MACFPCEKICGAMDLRKIFQWVGSYFVRWAVSKKKEKMHPAGITVGD
jgi:hypothetical protein